MLAKDIEARVKDYPTRIKDENVRLAGLSKAFAALGKTHQNNIKETNTFATLVGSIDQTKECSENFQALYSSMRGTLQQVIDEQNAKASRVKDLVITADNFQKENLDNQKEVQEKGASNQLTGIQIMQRDLKQVQKHKRMFQEFIFAEMKEHAKLLEYYSKLFEETTIRVNIQKEFYDVMITEGKFNQSQIQEYINMKMKGMMAADLGAQFRGGSAQGPRSQSAQGRPQRMTGAPSDGAQSQQRGRSEVPPQVGRR